MLVIPLGGCGEFGRNATAYVAAGQVLLVDCGIQMPDDLSPGVDYFVPDLRGLLARYGPPHAVVLTHGHEDHIGAVGHLLRTVGEPIPVWGRRLTLELCTARFARDALPRRLWRPCEMIPGQPLRIGADPAAGPCIEVTPLAVPHSIPEACALLVRGPLAAAGTEPAPAAPYAVLHTGDYKLDEIAGSLQAFPLPAQPLDLLVGDSTNAATPGRARYGFGSFRASRTLTSRRSMARASRSCS